MNPTDTAEPQPLDFAATTANARGDDPLAAGAEDVRAEKTKPLSWQGKLPPVALTGRFEADAMFAAITAKCRA
jgi:hypothetical protein